MLTIPVFTQERAKEAIAGTDTIKPPATGKALKSKVTYSAKDSMVVDAENQQILLFGSSEVSYEKINVKAAFIKVDFSKNEMFANGLKDSSGKIYGKPEFTEDNETFTADNITYNFKTKKGIVRHIRTKEGEGYLHGNKVKKMPDNIVFLNTGSYTTCDKTEPDFEIRFMKAKVIPDTKIVSGPALLFIEGVPTPLGVPFGYFPINKGRKSGIIIPSYGESSNRGFFLENGGYYWGINDYIDLSLKGDIYSRAFYSKGSWALKAESNYNRLYHYSGSISMNYSENVLGEKDLPGYSDNKDFFFRWTHNQSQQARPNSRFSANVNLGSSKYNSFNPSTTRDYLTNTFQSSISYSTSFANKYNLSINLRHSQNTQTRIMDITLPELTFSANRFYPFQKKERVGKPGWYENISINYVMNARNEISTPDSLFLKGNILKKMNNGIRHSIPISSSLKIMKHFTMTNSLSYNERWYFNSIRKTALSLSEIISATQSHFKTDTVNGLQTERDFSLSSSLNTKLYGIFQFKKGFIRAIRHVVTPSLGIYYTPYFRQYYNNYTDPVTNKTITYSKFQNGIYGSAPSAKSGRVNFSLSNNIEMKVRSSKDTVTGFKKIMLIEDLTISESYDLAKDSLQLSMLTLNGHTKLFKNIDLKYSSAWDPYIRGQNNVRLNRFVWNENRQLFIWDNTQWALSFNWNISSKNRKKASDTEEGSRKIQKTKPEDVQGQNIIVNPNGDGYVDFEVPWNFNVYYTLMWTNYYEAEKDIASKSLVQTLAFNGDINLTKKWKIGFTSGYDLKNHDFSYTSVNIYRDLHCWEMIFNWIPNGFRKSYNFTIRVKASILKDLKLMKKTDWRDAQY